jgi:hypothetical protein
VAFEWFDQCESIPASIGPFDFYGVSTVAINHRKGFTFCDAMVATCFVKEFY